MIVVSNRVGLATVAAVLCALAIFGLIKAAGAVEIGRGYAQTGLLQAAPEPLPTSPDRAAIRGEDAFAAAFASGATPDR